MKKRVRILGRIPDSLKNRIPIGFSKTDLFFVGYSNYEIPKGTVFNKIIFENSDQEIETSYVN